MKINNKSLICITTCNRIEVVKLFIADYLEYVKNNPKYDFVLSLDGFDQKYIDFCEKYNIPLIYSEKREGVGISKNRVLRKFQNYDYYFFLDDDVELLDGNVFEQQIQVANATNIHHFSLGENHRFFGNRYENIHNGYKVIHSDYGSGAYNFFTKKGLDVVGGWHTEFAKYKRFGHTEHSMRFPRNKLAPSAFNVFSDHLFGYFNWYNPEQVTNIKVEKSINTRLSDIEQNIVDLELYNYSIETISNYQYLDKKININNVHELHKNINEEKIIFYRNTITSNYQNMQLLMEKNTNIYDSKSYVIGNKIVKFIKKCKII